MAGQHRRDFLKTSTAMGAAYWVGARSLSAQETTSANEEIHFACVGVGGKGSSDSSSAGRAGNVIGICDIDSKRLNQKGSQFKEAKKFADFREMLDTLGDKVDAVTVSTPDHTHAVAAMMGLKMKKHVFCQKPLTWSIYEARALREKAKEMGVCTQMGNQGTAGNGLREAVEVIRSGYLGEVREVHVWTNRPVWPQGKGRPEGTPPVPENISWDLFLGPAPERPYHPEYQPFKWRGWVDFGTGALGDMACHTINMPVMALDLFNPTSVVADSPGIFQGESFPKSSKIFFEFPQRGNLPPVKLTWYDGGRKPDASLLEDARLADRGALVIGDKGKLYSTGDYGSSYSLLPKENFTDSTKPEQSLPRSPGHFTEFANAIKADDPSLAMSNFDYAGRLTETILLGNLSLFTKDKVEWDAEKLAVTNADKIENGDKLAKVVKRDYRKGWAL